MDEKKSTPEGLPVVTRKLLEVLARDFDKEVGDYSYILDESTSDVFSGEIDKMFKGNPELCYFMNNHVNSLSDNGSTLIEHFPIEVVVKMCYMSGAFSCYSALRRQAESNKLEEELK